MIERPKALAKAARLIAVASVNHSHLVRPGENMSIHRDPRTFRGTRSFAVHASSAALLLFPMLTSCSQSVAPDAEPVATVAEEGLGTCNVNITPLRSIEIVHPNVVSSARSSNATDGT